MTKKKYIIPIFIPHQGCPNDCIFCNQNKITCSNSKVTHTDILNTIDTYLGYFPKTAEQIEIAFFGGSFTGLPKDVMMGYLETVKSYVESGKISSIRLSTRPDYINEDILKTLKRYHVKTIELGVQSMNDEVLELNNRGMNSDDVIKASHLIKSYKFILGLQMMTGMYGSNKSIDIYTAKSIIELKPDFVRIYPTLVIPDTALYDLYTDGNYSIMDLEELVPHLMDIVCMFESEQISIIRIGLPEEYGNLDNAFIGPSHPSLRQIVYSELYLEAIIPFLTKLEKAGPIYLYADNSVFSYLVGYGARNKTRLLNNYDIKFIPKTMDAKIIEIENSNNITKVNMLDFFKNRNRG